MNNITIICEDQITAEHVIEAYALDLLVYPKQYHLSIKTCLNYYNANKCIYTMLLIDGKVAGYINFSPIDEATYYKLRSGKYTDLCIKPENILAYQDNSTYWGYFSSIVITPSLQNKGYAKMLLNEFILHLTKMTERGIYFKRILANVISDGGCAMMNKFGLHKIKKIKTNFWIYEAMLMPNKMIASEYNKMLFQKYPH